jgi:2,3-diaminopropionate biosynthesis protein SbnB
VSDLCVIPGAAVSAVLSEARPEVMKTVETAYRLYHAGEAVNPPSCFLRFPAMPGSRIIALPAFAGGDSQTAGVKWISSFPGNLEAGMPRASAVLILNDCQTGRPYALLEAAGISAARTAASAAIACTAVCAHGRERPAAWLRRASVAFVGTGVIARAIAAYLQHAGLGLTDVICHDLAEPRAAGFCRWLAEELNAAGCRTAGLAAALEQDLVLFATTAAAPYVPAGTRLRPGQLVLHVSLRDLAPETLLAANNVVDDVGHCLTAQTSPHLAAGLSGSRDFITGTIGQALAGRLRLDPGRPTIVSPFGLGVLDVAVGRLVYERARGDARVVTVGGFIPG